MSAKINILFFGFTPNIASATNLGLSGGEVRFFKILNKNSKKLDITCLGTKIWNTRLNANNIKHHWIPLHTNLTYKNQIDLFLKSILLIIIHLRKIFLLNDKKYVLYPSSDLFWETFPCMLRKIFYPKDNYVQCIFHVYPNWKKRSGNMLINFFGFTIQKISHFFIKHFADTVVVINPLTKQTLIKLGFDSRKIYLNYCGFDSINYKPTTKTIDAISISRIQPSKGIHNIIKTWYLVVQKRKNAKLIIIGGFQKDSYYLELQKFIKVNKLTKNITMKGYVAEKLKQQQISKSRIFLSCSTEEGFNISILEALAHKLWVIAFKLPVYTSIFKKNIIQVKHSPETMAKTVLAQLKSNLNNNIKTNFLQQFNWDKIAQKEYEIFNAKS